MQDGTTGNYTHVSGPANKLSGITGNGLVLADVNQDGLLDAFVATTLANSEGGSLRVYLDTGSAFILGKFLKMFNL